MEMKRNLLLLIGLCMAVCVQAQKKNFSYKFYGQVRGDLFYNSRANAEIVDGLFHLYPKDVALDADGKELGRTGYVPGRTPAQYVEFFKKYAPKTAEGK